MRAVIGLVYRAGLWPEKRTLDRVPVGTAYGYHVEVEAPDDIEIVGGALTAEDPGLEGEKPKLSRAHGADHRRRLPAALGRASACVATAAGATTPARSRVCNGLLAS